MTDLLRLTAELVDVPSVSFEEGALADLVEAELRAVAGLEVTRVGDNVVARSTGVRPLRLILAGHLDTVPAGGNAQARIEGDVLWGLGAADMKGGLAVMLDLARSVTAPAVEVTYVFYAREEVAAVHNGLAELYRLRPDLLEGDVAIVGEPTAGAVEAGCQGTMRCEVTLAGRRAHTARAWTGVNAIHRLHPLLGVVGAYQPRRPEIAGCRFHEGLQAVGVEAGVGGNVVPDSAKLVLNHRFAPDRSPEQAEAHVRDVLSSALGPDDTVEVVDFAAGAWPATEHPLVSGLVGRNGLEVRAKLGWTDVARFSAAGVPAANFGPGDPNLAHCADERVERAELELVHSALEALILEGV